MALDAFVTHSDLVKFADEKVNLKREDVKNYRIQVNDLRDRLKNYIDSHPHFDLVKMLHSGSVAKGTALKSVNDMDVAVYVKKASAPKGEADILNWLKERLMEAYGGWKDKSDYEVQHHCITVKFHGTGLDVDVAPVIYEGDKDDKGYLISKETGQRVMTSIPMHLTFCKRRKEAHKTHYRQLVRFVKWWKRTQESQRDNLKFKSFMIELLIAYMFDNGLIKGNDYPEALAQIFAYINSTGLRQQIAFADNYPLTKIMKVNDFVKVFDPVNPENNVASLYTEQNRQAIVEAAADALDAITYARRATTKAEAETAWREVLGNSFKV